MSIVRLRELIRARVLLYIGSLMLSSIFGAVLGPAKIDATDKSTADGARRAAYLIASWEILHPDQLKPFDIAVVPLAKRAGYDLLAVANPQVLEGNWPYKGVLIVQKYTSMQTLLDFWRSPEHDAAKKLREGHVDSHFVVAVEAPE
jgi:uncharacterized protein (DUF1330 family)